MPTIADLVRAEQRVFPTHARVERYYPATAAEEARGVLSRCLDRGEGPALLIGAPGTGKSMLLEVLANDLGRERPIVSLTSAQLCTRRALLQSILFELGQTYRQRDEGELRLTLTEYLSGMDVARLGVLLLVDEAQALPLRLLEELRVLGNVSHQGVPIVRLLLAGSQALEEKFAEPDIEVFNQRIVARCYLAPFNHHDTAQFVRAHLAAAGGTPDELFTADALDAVYHATGGIARLINQVCDRALVIAAGHAQTQVTKEIIEGAWADLQQLPTPWNLPDVPEAAEQSDDSEDVVEFGPLSDDQATFESADDMASDSPSAEPAQRSATARVYQPTVDADDWLSGPTAHRVAEEPEPKCAPAEIVDSVETPSQSEPVAPQSAVAEVGDDEEPPVAPLDDLFGCEPYEEEVVIDESAPLEAGIRSGRPRVTNTKRQETDISRLLHDVMQTTTAGGNLLEEQPALDEVSSSRHRDEKPISAFSVVDVDRTELDELPAADPPFAPDGAAREAIANVPAGNDGGEQWSRDDIDILVVEDELTGAADLATAQRADYRQLFNTLRHS